MSDSRGQRSKECDIIGCTKKGRILANLSGIEIAYCPTHRKKYGERVIDALINSVFNHKLSRFLTEIKTEVFFGSDFFCDNCAKKVKDLILEKTEDLEGLIEYADKNNIDGNDKNEI